MTLGPRTVVEEGATAPTRRGNAWGWWTASAVVVVPALIPPLTLVVVALSGDAGIGIRPGRLLELLTSTLLLTVAVTVTALSLGTATAWITSRTDIPGRAIWRVLAALPLVVPSYVAALTIIGATGRSGLIATWLGLAVPTPYGFVGAWLALSIFLAPMVHLIVTPGLAMIDPASEEAASGLGASQRRTFMTVTLPQLRPALVSASLMVGLYTVSDFGAVSLLRYDSFTRAIYTLYVGQIDRRPAAVLSLVLMMLAVAILLAERRFRRRATTGLGKLRRRRRLIALTRGQKTVATGVMMLFGTLSLVIPVAVLGYWLARGSAAGQGLGSLWPESWRSLGVSGLAALVTATAAFPLAMVTTRLRSKTSGTLETAVWGVYALPHIAIGVGMVAFALNAAFPLYQSLTLLVVTYMAMFLAQAMSATQDSLMRASLDLEDASRGLGRGAIATLRRITLPLARPGMVAGGALVFLSVMKELPATLLLRPNGFETLAVRIWSATGEGFYTRASAAGLVLLAVSAIPLLAVTRRDFSD